MINKGVLLIRNSIWRGHRTHLITADNLYDNGKKNFYKKIIQNTAVWAG
jgi:hypothetical protein